MATSTKLEPETGMNDDEISLLDLFMVVAENIKLLIVGPLVVGVLAYVISYALPKTYTSEAYFRLNTEEAQRASEFILSPAVLDKVIAKYPIKGATPEGKRRNLRKEIEWISGEAGVATMRFTDGQPARAQAINLTLIDTWIELTKPGPDQTVLVKQQIELSDLQLNSVTSLIDRLAKETPQLVIPGMQNELATSLASLQAERNRLVSQKEALQRSLLGTSRDVVLVSPTLPVEPAFPPKAKIAAFCALAGGVFLLGFVLLRTAFRLSTADPRNAAKIKRIRNSLLLRQKAS